MTWQQWIGLGLFVLVVSGLVWAYTRKGLPIRPDPENKPPSDQGGQPTV